MADSAVTYRYGQGKSADREYVAGGFHPVVKKIMYLMNIDNNLKFNACFLNRYDNQQNHLGWHADDSVEMDINHPIAVISFGAEREIWWKDKDYRGVVPQSNRQLLQNGSLFIMPAGFQRLYVHRIPKADRDVGMRISLTYRHYLTGAKK